MDDFSGMRVGVGLLAEGYAQACERFEVAEGKNDPRAAFFALFEALDWAHAIDDVIIATWSPRGEVVGFAWRTDPAIWGAGEELETIMDGLRYVRNRVHHQWADAIDTTKVSGGLTFPMRFPMTFGTVKSWVWRPADDLPTPPDEGRAADGREAYETALAGRRPGQALEALRVTFPEVAAFLDPPKAAVPRLS